MEHPFLNKNELETKTLEEIQETISQLMNKLNFAYRMSNGPMIYQLQMVLEGYKAQQRKRMDDIFEKQKLTTKINIQSENEFKN